MKAVKLVIIFIIMLAGIMGTVYVIEGGSTSESSPVEYNTGIDSDETSDQMADDYNRQVSDESCRRHSPMDDCDQTFDSKEEPELNQHIIDKHRPQHQDVHKFTCEICGRDTWFKTQMELENHKRVRHHHVEER